MRNKKLFVFAALAGVVLTGCSEIKAHPGDYDDPILNNEDGTKVDVVNNIASVVYDALDDAGTTNEQVLKTLKIALAESIFGTPEELEAAYTGGASSDAFKTLKESHAYYTEDIEETLSDADKNAYSFWRLEQLLAEVKDRILDAFYGLIIGGDYSDDSLFSEEKFANFIRSELYVVEDPATEQFPTTFYEDVLITPSKTYETIATWGIHIDYYEDYIRRVIIPDIYVDLLAEQYLFDENYSSLGRSYARKVNYIAITSNDEFANAAPYLMLNFIEQNILADEATAETANLEILANAWRGYEEDYLEGGNETELLNLSLGAGSFQSKTTRAEHGSISYYSGTQYGNILDDYDLIYENDPQKNDQTVESDFTNSYAYTIEKGLELKTRTMRTTDYTTDGWFIQNGGLSTLPSWIRTRLFNIGVANAIDDITDEKDTSVEEADRVTSNFVRKINGYYYLLPQTTQSGSEDVDFLLYDNDSKTYYIIQIEEAVSSSKLNRNSQNNYTNIHNDHGEYMEEVARNIAETMAEGGSYDDQAILFYFENMDLQYYDEDLYDYFVETFPDLFEDD